MMAIPNLPAFFDMKYTLENGDMTPDSFLYNDNMFQSLNNAVFILNDIVATSIASDNTVTNNGIKVPNKTTAEITAYGLDTTIALGSIYFDTDVAKLKVKTAASVIETITSA